MLLFKPHSFEYFQQNLITSKSTAIYHCSLTTAYGIGRAQKLRKQNINLLYSTTDTSLAPSTHLYSYEKLNENTDINSKNN